jgi:linoleoyl-CoA desaturase
MRSSNIRTSLPGAPRQSRRRRGASAPEAGARHAVEPWTPGPGPHAPARGREAALPPPRFPARSAFHATVTQRVAQYFATRHLATTGDWRLFLKTGVILAWLAGSYGLLVFGVTSWLGALLAGGALAQGLALAGFNIMHDGAHDSYAQRPTINRLMGGMLNVLGGSQWVWRHKHNRLHHVYTNIHPFDDDLETHGLLRLHPAQAWRPWHRWQHVYAWAVYSLLTLWWVTVGDVRKLVAGHIGPAPLPTPTVVDVSMVCVTKLVYGSYALLLPWWWHPWQHVLLAFVGVHLLFGVTLSLVFQLAHTTEHSAFPTPEGPRGVMPTPWAVHAVETTANFAPRNPLVAWYVGGLNFQIEHHLFARISHIHYPALSAIVAATCQEYALPYVCYPTVRAALAGHCRFLRRMGRRPADGQRARGPAQEAPAEGR